MEMMVVNKVTITGADDSTDISEMIDISKAYPWVEWGILLLKDKMGTPRYPSQAWLDKLAGTSLDPDWNFAAHVCGAWTKSILMGDPCVFNEVDMSIFQRVQLNFRPQKTYWVPQFVAELPEDYRYIFQMGNIGNDAATFALENGANACILFDRSGGKGVSPDSWPEPIPNVYCGYAGGLGPDNITAELEKIGAVVPKNRSIWIDMETKVRVDDDSALDMQKVRRVLSLVYDI
jgi:hypothetical protein